MIATLRHPSPVMFDRNRDELAGQPAVVLPAGLPAVAVAESPVQREIPTAAWLESRRQAFVEAGGLEAVSDRIRDYLSVAVPPKAGVAHRTKINADLRRGWAALNDFVRARREALIEEYGEAVLMDIIGDRWPYVAVVSPGSTGLANLAKGVRRAEELVWAHAWRAEALEAERQKLILTAWTELSQKADFKNWHRNTICYAVTRCSSRQELGNLEVTVRKARLLLGSAG